MTWTPIERINKIDWYLDGVQQTQIWQPTCRQNQIRNVLLRVPRCCTFLGSMTQLIDTYTIKFTKKIRSTNVIVLLRWYGSDIREFAMEKHHLHYYSSYTAYTRAYRPFFFFWCCCRFSIKTRYFICRLENIGR